MSADTPTPPQPALDLEKIEREILFDNAVRVTIASADLRDFIATLRALQAERDRLREALKDALFGLECGQKIRHPDWDGYATPSSAIGKARAALAASGEGDGR